jgi:hypothetical protein
LNLAKGGLSRQKEVVRVFCKDMWDHADTALVPQICHRDFTFRGSLGPQLVGHQRGSLARGRRSCQTLDLTIPVSFHHLPEYQ